jgi:hypothetical protein
MDDFGGQLLIQLIVVLGATFSATTGITAARAWGKASSLDVPRFSQANFERVDDRPSVMETWFLESALQNKNAAFFTALSVASGAAAALLPVFVGNVLRLIAVLLK